MQQNNGNNMDAVTAGCMTQAFRDCGSGGDGSTFDVQFLNSVMAELLNVVCKSCQNPLGFDASNPATYNQIWNAISRFGGTDGIAAWTSGTSNLIVTHGGCNQGCNLYLANTDGNPSTTQPGTGSDWYGPFCSIGAVLEQLASVIANQIRIQSLDCVNGTITVSDGNQACVISGSQPITPLTGCMQAVTSTPGTTSNARLWAACDYNFPGGGGDPAATGGNFNFLARIL